MAVSTRQAWMDKLSSKSPPPLLEYEILDPNHKPDLNGELAGGKVYRKAGKEHVMLTEDQARFYLDSGSIKPAEPAA